MSLLDKFQKRRRENANGEERYDESDTIATMLRGAFCDPFPVAGIQPPVFGVTAASPLFQPNFFFRRFIFLHGKSEIQKYPAAFGALRKRGRLPFLSGAPPARGLAAFPCNH